VQKGDFKGNIVTRQHRYYAKGGSYDWSYIISPKGEELGNSGEDVSLKDFLNAAEEIDTRTKRASK